MDEAGYWKRMFAETARECFVLKYKNFDQLDQSVVGTKEEVERKFETLNKEMKSLHDEVMEFNRIFDEQNEIEGYKKRIRELENQEELRLRNEQALKHLLETLNKEMKSLHSEVMEFNRICNEIKEYEVMCDRLKEQIKSLEEDKRIASERITSLEEEMKEKYVEFIKEIKDLQGANRRAEDEIEIWKKKFADLECGKRRADDEIEILKKRCIELEIQASKMLNHGAELEDCKAKCQSLSTALKAEEMECAEYEGKMKNLMSTKAALEHELEDCKTNCSGMEEEITSLEKIMSESDKVSHERIACLDELVKVLECGKRQAEDEINILQKKCMELEIQASEMLKHGAELEDYKTKCLGLSTALKVKEMECVEHEGKMKNLMSTKVALDQELEDYKTTCSGMEEEITGLRKIVSEKDKTSHERFTCLDELVKVLECGKRRAEDETENWKKRFTDLECGKRSFENEIELLKKKCMDLEIQASEMLNHGAELGDYKAKCHSLSTALKAKEMECAEYEGKMKNLMSTKVSLDHELEDYKTTCSGKEEKITDLEKIMSEREKTSQERIACLDELVKVLECGKRRAEDEINILKKKSMELEIQASHGAELEDYKTKCQGLSTALKVKEMACVEFEGKLKNLMSTKDALDQELEDYKTACSGMEEEITGLRKIVSEKDKTSQERFACLDELVKVLECGKRRAEDETENWKKRFSELEMGLGGLQEEAAYDAICLKYMDDYVRRKLDGKVIASNVAQLTESAKVPSPAYLPSSNISSFHENLEDVQASETHDIKNQCDHSANVKVEKRNTISDIKVELVSEAKQQLG